MFELFFIDLFRLFLDLYRFRLTVPSMWIGP